MRLQLWRVFGGFLTIAVAFLMIATNTRNLAHAYSYVDSSSDWATLIALMIVGAMILALMFPTYQAARWVFIGLAAAVVIAVAINAAPRLGLIDAAPVQWRWIILIGTTLPFPFVGWLAWVLVTHRISKPTLALALTETRTETDPKPEPKPKLLGETDRKSGTGTRIRIQRPPQQSQPKPTPEPDETDTETNTETDQLLYLTVETLRRQGRVAKAARVLGCSTTMVNKRLKILYAKDPRTVEQAVPDWVDRNIGTLVKG